MKKYSIVNPGYNVPINFLNVARLKWIAWPLIWKRSLTTKKYRWRKNDTIIGLGEKENVPSIRAL